MGAVFASSNASLAHGGQRIPIRIGEAWDAADPLVAQYPSMFTAHPQGVRTTSNDQGWKEYTPDDEEAPVETARRGPGERRNTKRPRR